MGATRVLVKMSLGRDRKYPAMATPTRRTARAVSGAARDGRRRPRATGISGSGVVTTTRGRGGQEAPREDNSVIRQRITGRGGPCLRTQLSASSAIFSCQPLVNRRVLVKSPTILCILCTKCLTALQESTII